MANTTIALRQSGATGNTPSLGVIANGEISLNYADGILYYKTAANTLGSIRTTQPAGLTTEVQFNDAGSFGTDSNFTYNKTTDILTVVGGVIAAGINVAPALAANSAYIASAYAKANTDLANTGTSVTANGLTQYIFANTTASTSNATGAVVIQGGVGVQGNVYSTNQFVRGDVVAGLADGSALGGATNPIIAAIGNTDQYIQTYTINYSNTANASSDLVAYPNNGQDANGWIDMGITSNAYACTAFSITGRNEGYLFMSAPGGSGTSGNLVIATDSTGTYNSIEFVVGGFAKGKSNSNVKITTATSSTSNVTGALQVSGGIGVKGNVTMDAANFSDGTRQTSAGATMGDVLAISIALG